MKIETAAMKWHAARQRRLAAQKLVRIARNNSNGWVPMQELFRLEAGRAEAKRIETRALRVLAQACAAHKATQLDVEDGERKPRLPSADVIDI